MAVTKTIEIDGKPRLLYTSSSQKTAAPGTNVRRHYDQKVLELGAKRGTGLVRQRTHLSLIHI